ncbi:hypothetical protein [Stenotrophomonas sp. TD3]|uniref:hypothetical protein n=1 Tax=Stenotrophomonas sp. TD3 TaxID=1641707 RepID=UPI0009527670|nr:hypothetical protein [Stenotrophomonas sp. TD3]
MATGMQIFGPDGQMWFDTNDRAGKIMGTLSVVGSSSSSVGLAGMGEPFAILPSPGSDSWQDQNGNQFSAPALGYMSFADGGNTLRMQFTFSPIANPSASIYYGVF